MAFSFSSLQLGESFTVGRITFRFTAAIWSVRPNQQFISAGAMHDHRYVDRGRLFLRNPQLINYARGVQPPLLLGYPLAILSPLTHGRASIALRMHPTSHDGIATTTAIERALSHPIVSEGAFENSNRSLGNLRRLARYRTGETHWRIVCAPQFSR